ncbi:MAG TPA: 1-deoxy-D-xylulose-5-phosphate synthase N-terminal domain-containing protein [bacterium]|nr:1-deoxy-D-xylulose-5-phosphate synthase N-terminal domain-containing protein [bacterium]
MSEPLKPITPEELKLLEAIERKALWLSTYTIHYANKVRPNPDAIKVGGHQASTASVVSLLTALMCRVMTPQDRLALKPHSSPAYHALQAMLGNLDPDKLKEFRQFGGIQSYPSRRKDTDGVHFNTGSVGLGGVNVLFSALVQDYVRRHFPQTDEPGRYISLMGDAEMEEGTLYEALVEGQNYNLRDLWWIIDLNRQSLDKLLNLNRVRQLYEIFVSFGWEVIVLKYSRSLTDLFGQPGGADLKRWFDDVGNAEYQTLLRLPPDAYREQLLEQVGSRSKAARALIAQFDAKELKAAIMHLAGHDMHMICEAFDRAAAVKDRPVAILAYTIKGYDLPLAGHKDNHSGLLSTQEIDALRDAHRVRAGEEFDLWAGMDDAPAVQSYLEASALHASRKPQVSTAPPRLSVPLELGLRYKPQVSTQAAFGQVLLELSRVKGVGERIVTSAPDVAISTNLGGWINRVGIYQPESRPDFYEKYDLKSPFRWKEVPAGRHIELGIAENNFFSLLAALGLSAELNNNLLFPVGTVYDVFLKRGLDMLSNGIYSHSRFILVGTPSGVTLAPEGGAHQSYVTPLFGMGFADLHYFEPSFAKEVEVLMCWGLDQLQDRADGRSLYLRLSTNPLEQVELPGDAAWRRQVIAGGYWLRDYRSTPDYATAHRFNLVTTGVMTAQALAASDQLREEGVYANVIQITSPDRLYEGWRDYLTGSGAPPYLHELFPAGERHPVVSVIDGHPLTLQWMGEALGVPQIALGVTTFGQSGDIESLYRAMGIHADDIVAAVGRLIVDGVRGRDASNAAARDAATHLPR